jgi:hypothetical protein
MVRLLPLLLKSINFERILLFCFLPCCSLPPKGVIRQTKNFDGNFVMFPIVAKLVALIVRPTIVAQSMLLHLARRVNDGTSNFPMRMA